MTLKKGGKDDQAVVGWGVRRMGKGPGSYNTSPPVVLSSYPNSGQVPRLWVGSSLEEWQGRASSCFL